MRCPPLRCPTSSSWLPVTVVVLRCCCVAPAVAVVIRAVRARVEAEKALRDAAKAVRREKNVQRHEARLAADRQSLAALQEVNRAKRAAYFETVRRKRVQWLQALHEDSRNWIAENEVDSVRVWAVCIHVPRCDARGFICRVTRCCCCVGRAEDYRRPVLDDAPVAFGEVVRAEVRHCRVRDGRSCPVVVCLATY